MRNFIAVLKDSFREARNGYVLQVMMGLIALLILLFMSISFRQLSQQEKLSSDLSSLINFAFSSSPEFGRFRMAAENVSEVREGDSWNTPYSYDLIVTFPNEAMYQKASKKTLPIGFFKSVKLPTSKEGVIDYYKTLNPSHGEFTVIDITPPSDRPKPEAKDKKEKPDDDEGSGGKPVILRYRVDAQSSIITEQKEWPHEVKVFFAVGTGLSFSQRDLAYYLENYVVNGIGSWIFSLLAVVITAFFVPNMIQKGALDLVIAKPIGRIQLLLYKYVGGLSFAFLLFAFTVLGIYLLVGIRMGIWSPVFLAAIPVLTVQFAILYSVSVLFGVLTRGSIVAILATVAAWFLIFCIGKLNDGVRNHDLQTAEFEKSKSEIGSNPIDPQTGKSMSMEEVLNRMNPNRPLWGFIPTSTFPAIRIVHTVTPRSFQLDYKMGRLIAEGVLTERQLKERGWDEPSPASWGEVLGVSAAFIALMLGLASWRFATRDP